jgi:hypothetical protein
MLIHLLTFLSNLIVIISLPITLVNTIFVTNKLFSVSDIIFYTEFKYVLSSSISRKVFK